jgi:hypothetical protein
MQPFLEKGQARFTGTMSDTKVYGDPWWMSFRYTGEAESSADREGEALSGCMRCNGIARTLDFELKARETSERVNEMIERIRVCLHDFIVYRSSPSQLIVLTNAGQASLAKP